MTHSPFFSIIVPTRNRGQALETCLDAIQSQSFSDYEVLILDDGSEREIRQQHQQRQAKYDQRFNWYQINADGARGSGPSAIRNMGIEKAKGDYIAFCDDDDCWHRNDYLEVAAEALKKSQAQACFSGMQIKNEQGEVVIAQQMEQVSKIVPEQGEKITDTVYSVSSEHILRYPDYAHLNITIVKSTLLKEIGGFWEHTCFAEDVDLFVRVSDKAEKILFRPEICATHFAPENRNAPSVSNTVSMNNKRLLEISVYQHLLLCCTGRPALDYARQSLAITEKLLTEELVNRQQKTAARVFSLSAWAAWPGLKWALYTLFLQFRR